MAGGAEPGGGAARFACSLTHSNKLVEIRLRLGEHAGGGERGRDCSVSTLTSSRLGRELGQVVDSQSLFDVRHAVHHFLESVVAEELVLLLLELLAERVELVPRDD